MKIQKVKIKKFKILEDVEKEVKGNHILLIGDNSRGKSSFIQFLQIALGNSKVIPPGVDGDGVVWTSKDGNEYKFDVKIRDGKSVVTITGPDGGKDSRKGYLSQLCGAVEFDINSFVELSKTPAGRREQIEIFKSFLPQEVQEDLKSFENRVKTSYDERTDVNRKIKELDGSVRTNPIAGQTLSQFKQVDVASAMASLKSIQEANAKIEKVIVNHENRAIEIKSIEEQIKTLKASLKEKVDLQEQATKWMKENPVQSTASLEDTINNATQANNDYQLAQSLKTQLDKLEELRAESGELTALIESQKQAISDTITNMDSPVEGLMYDEYGLVYNGIPVNPDSLSTSEIMLLGVQMKMAESADLGIIFLPRGESLGTERLQQIIDMCNENGFELVMEEVRRGVDELQIELFTDKI